MTRIIQFISKEQKETERMIKEARARYESIFPTERDENQTKEKAE